MPSPGSACHGLSGLCLNDWQDSLDTTALSYTQDFPHCSHSVGPLGLLSLHLSQLYVMCL